MFFVALATAAAAIVVVAVVLIMVVMVVGVAAAIALAAAVGVGAVLLVVSHFCVVMIVSSAMVDVFLVLSFTSVVVLLHRRCRPLEFSKLMQQAQPGEGMFQLSWGLFSKDQNRHARWCLS